MRHGKKFNHLSRKSQHRKAMLSNMACSLIQHKRINTTVAKAKALRKYVEPLITKSKDDSTHSRRTVFSYLRDKQTVNELFREVAPKIAERPGGYTRIIRVGNRLGDNAEMCMIELVDYNELLLAEKELEKGKKKSTRRGGSRRGGKKKSSPQADASQDATAKQEETPTAEPKQEAKAEEAPKAEVKKEETPKAEAKKDEAPKAEAKKEETPKAEAKAEDKKKEEPKAEAKAEAPKAEKKEAKEEKKEEKPKGDAKEEKPKKEDDKDDK